ncbi:MAG: DUF1015 domain-containing protein [Ruminococcaceae bacterium]|jgi:hypothetical protein|nr:DUF1015 domain-containing protein [Oscillospiraceae bacterium]
MNKYNTVFSSADILLPAFSSDPGKMRKWSVIACDQFTSEPAYWSACREEIGGAPSTLRFIMPEAYLGTPDEAAQSETVREAMESFDPRNMRRIDGFVYTERSLPDGSVRRGIVGAVDLEGYDYAADSSSPVRATEGTVLERIPPRQRIRAEAKAEFPHVLVLADDRIGLFDEAHAVAGSLLYDFDLMQGGGHIRGYAVNGFAAERLSRRIAEYERSMDGLVYAVGDGNHSLAAAKAHWETVKREIGSQDHPARYALCEITPIGDESLRFEPIYRIVRGCGTEELMEELRSVSSPDGAGQPFTVVTAKGRAELRFSDPADGLTVRSVQRFIDRFLAAHPGTSCDYIHGERSLLTLASEPDTAGFLFGGMDKNELFPYVKAYGKLPRKTFSMGEAESKRYYLEARSIVR